MGNMDDSMTIDDFKRWNVDALKDSLCLHVCEAEGPWCEWPQSNDPTSEWEQRDFSCSFVDSTYCF